MKRTILIMLAALLCVSSLAGCSSSQQTSSPASQTASETSVPVKDDEPSKAETPSSADTQSSEETPAPQPSEQEQPSEEASEDDTEVTEENGVIVVHQNGHYRALELFGGGTGNAYVSALNELRSQLDGSIRIYSMIDPLPCAFYLPEEYSEYSVDQKESFDDIASRLDSGITTVDAYSALQQHTSENIYCRTDHHWMPLGAFYAAEAFAVAAGVPFKSLDTFRSETIPGFVGTMYAFTDGDINIKNDPEDFIYYVPDNYPDCKTDFYDTSFNFDYTGSYFKEVGDPQSNAYLTFFGGDEQIVKIRTNVKNGRKLMVVKDSYGNAIPGNLMNSFEEIYIADMRYFNPNLVDFINTMGVTDVLFTMATFSAFGANADNLSVMISQAKGNEIVDHYAD